MKDPRETRTEDTSIYVCRTDMGTTLIVSTDPSEPWACTHDELIKAIGGSSSVPELIRKAVQAAAEALGWAGEYTHPHVILSNVPEEMWEELAPHVSNEFIEHNWMPHPADTIRALAAKYLPLNFVFDELIDDVSDVVRLELCKRLSVEDPRLDQFHRESSILILNYLSSLHRVGSVSFFLRSPYATHRRNAVSVLCAAQARCYSNDPDPLVRKQVCLQQTDRTEIMKFKDDSHTGVQITALEMLNTQDAMEVFGSHPNPQIQVALIKKITPGLAREYFKYSEDPQVIKAMLAKQTPIFALRYRTHKDASVRKLVAEMQDLPTAVTHFAHDPHVWVRYAVARKVTKGDAYRGFVTDPEPYVRLAGIPAMSAQEAFMTFRFDPNEEVRAAMYGHVADEGGVS